MSNHFPIPSPPPELVQQWESRIFDEQENVDVLLIEAYKAGADQELEACCELLVQSEGNDAREFLRAARRPKPPSLKEQALTALHAVATGANDTREQHQDLDTIRRALEALDD